MSTKAIKNENATIKEVSIKKDLVLVAILIVVVMALSFLLLPLVFI